MSTPAPTLYVVDDDDAVRGSYGALFLSRGHVVRAFADGASFLAAADHTQAGCVLLDLRMDGLSGLQVFDELLARHSFIQTVFLSGHGELPSAVEAVRRGAFDWLQKGCDDERVLSTVAQAMQRSVAATLEHRSRAAVQARWERLTPREKEVALLLAQGLTAKEAVRAMEERSGGERAIEPRTLDAHRAKIFIKLDIRSTHELGMLIGRFDLT
jgi:two-component system response regulator DctR